MKMKKYTADTMVNAMKQIRADFGENAIIMSSNIVQSKGFLGLFKKKFVEVVAGFDEPVSLHKETAIQPVSRPVEDYADDSQTVDFKSEMKELKKMIRNLQQTPSSTQYPDEMQVIIRHLQKQNLSQSLVNEISEDIFNRMKAEKKSFTHEEQLALAGDFLKSELKGIPFGGISLKKKYINVLGPTGVGKTTTIAKIAARALLEKKKKVGFITTDTYRIAAIEQLRTYANLLQAPVEIVYNERDFKAAIQKFDDLDLVFIDTAGRNYKEAKFIEELSSLIDFSLEMESFLVLSMTTKEDDMQTIVQQFNALPIEKFIFTKMDETNSVGPMFSLMKTFEIGTAYITDGQEVPEDLTEADADTLVQLLLKECRQDG
jgi:flagellar biosynthesis protein FlhF